MCDNDPKGSDSSNTLHMLDERVFVVLQIHTSTHVTFWRVFDAILPVEAPASVEDDPETVARTSNGGTLDSKVMQTGMKPD
jgi:hypothetical protein